MQEFVERACHNEKFLILNEVECGRRESTADDAGDGSFNKDRGKRRQRRDTAQKRESGVRRRAAEERGDTAVP